MAVVQNKSKHWYGFLFCSSAPFLTSRRNWSKFRESGLKVVSHALPTFSDAALATSRTSCLWIPCAQFKICHYRSLFTTKWRSTFILAHLKKRQLLFSVLLKHMAGLKDESKLGNASSDWMSSFRYPGHSDRIFHYSQDENFLWHAIYYSKLEADATFLCRSLNDLMTWQILPQQIPIY